jgi:ferrous iron transport protein B
MSRKELETEQKEITVALAGNPNVGKSTVFNAMTGMRQHTGNWPGKTVERKEGTVKHRSSEIKVIDLPGTYSFTAISIEEIIARDFIVLDKPDVTVVVVNATSLERNLYLITQVLELTEKVVVALNMIDEADVKDIEIDVEKLSQILGVPVVPTIATKKRGIDEVLNTIEDVATGRIQVSPFKIQFSPEIEEMISKIEAWIKPGTYPKRWLATKLLEEDTAVAAMLRDHGNSEAVEKADKLLHIAGVHTEIALAERRYKLAAEICIATVKKPEIEEDFTDRLDEILTHKIIGLFILVGVLGFTLWAIYEIAAPVGGLFEIGFETLRDTVQFYLIDKSAPWWLTGIIVDGLLLGVEQIFVYMFAVLLVFYLIYSVLEDSGYLARGAYLLDRFMTKLGLPSKGFMSLFSGFGCNIPGVMATRILENEEDRIVTSFVNPMIPCSARIAVIATVVPLFFTGLMATGATLALLGISLLAVAVIARLLKRFALPGAVGSLVMELPDYRLPLPSNVFFTTLHKTYKSMVKALTVFIPFSILIWFVFTFPVGANVPYAGQISGFLDPVGALIGMTGEDWLPFLFSFPAKELTILYLNFAYGQELTEGADFLTNVWSPLKAFSWLTFMVLYTPCLATIEILREELNSWKWTGLVVVQELVTAFVFAGTIYWGGSLLGLG